MAALNKKRKGDTLSQSKTKLNDLDRVKDKVAQLEASVLLSPKNANNILELLDLSESKHERTVNFAIHGMCQISVN